MPVLGILGISDQFMGFPAPLPLYQILLCNEVSTVVIECPQGPCTPLLAYVWCLWYPTKRGGGRDQISR